MKPFFLAILTLLACLPVRALPKASDIEATRPLVNELLADDLAALKAGRKSASAVADAARALVPNAETSAAKYLLLKCAFTLSLRGKNYDTAAETIEALRAAVPDMTAADIVELIQASAKGVSRREAPKLFAVFRAAQAQVSAEREMQRAAAALAESPADPVRLRTAAEWCVHAGNWTKALAAFAKIDAASAQIAKAETSDPATAANFWWTYAPTVKHASLKDPAGAFRRHAAALYRKGIEDGSITGLKRTLAEKRIRQLTGEATSATAMDATAVSRRPADTAPVAPPAEKSPSGKLTSRSYVQKGLIAQWDGIDNAGYGVHRETLAVWKDLRGAHDFALTPAATVEDDAIACSGASYAGSMAKVFKKQQVVAVELVVDYISSAANSCFFSTGTVTGKSFDRAFGISHGNQWFVFGTSSLGPKKPGRYAVYIDFVGRKCYFNGELRPLAGEDSLDVLPVRGEEFYLGGFRNTGVKCKIHALRIYGRKLEDAERQKNLQIDRERFGL